MIQHNGNTENIVKYAFGTNLILDVTIHKCNFQCKTVSIDVPSRKYIKFKQIFSLVYNGFKSNFN